MKDLQRGDVLAAQFDEPRWFAAAVSRRELELRIMVQRLLRYSDVNGLLPSNIVQELAVEALRCAD